MKAALRSAAVAVLLAMPVALRAQEPQPANWTTKHSIQVAGQAVEYEATVGSVILRDTADRPMGELYFTAYFRTNAPNRATRPLIFSFNGGPGSASFWLHMGIMGPRRVRTPLVGQQAPAPYEIVDNAFTVLDVADIVMIDPIGTGFSRPISPSRGADFWGIDEDAASLTQFIRRFLSRYQRWNSPRYLLGESYGTTRSAVLVGHLQRANIDMNGVVLVSSVLQFNTLQFPPGDPLPYILNFPSYAITSEYLGKLPGGKRADLKTFMKEVEDWSLTEYATALLAGGAIDPARRRHVIQKMHEYTGLSPDFLDRADLRVTAPQYEAELLRDRGLVVGRLDARFTGPAGDRLSPTPSHDPQSTAISSAYTSAFNHYVRSELGYNGDREYVPSGGTPGWRWQRAAGSGVPFGFGSPNVAPDLATALRRNPTLEVLLINGLYDLATPYFAASWTMDHMGLPPDLRDNIVREDFAAGHMMYVEEPLLPQWRDALTRFIARTSKR